MTSFTAKAIGALGFCVLASTASAATFTVMDVDTSTNLGTFEAPEAGGLITAGSFSVAGGMFDVPQPDPLAPVYDATENWIVGSVSSFGGFRNSVAFNTVDFINTPVTCGVGECVLSFTSSGGIAPAEWYVDYAFLGDSFPIDLGNYTIVSAEIPLPAAGWLLLGSLAGLAGFRASRKE